MNKHILGVFGFVVILTIYVMVLTVVAPALPIVFLTAFLAWLIIRRPLTYPERIDSDIKSFSVKVGEIAGKLFELLVRPLTRNP